MVLDVELESSLFESFKLLLPATPLPAAAEFVDEAPFFPLMIEIIRQCLGRENVQKQLT